MPVFQGVVKQKMQNEREKHEQDDQAVAITPRRDRPHRKIARAIKAQTMVKLSLSRDSFWELGPTETTYSIGSTSKALRAVL